MSFKPFSYVFGVGCSLMGFIIYNYTMSNEKSIVIGAVLITAGIVSLLYSYS